MNCVSYEVVYQFAKLLSLRETRGSLKPFFDKDKWISIEGNGVFFFILTYNFANNLAVSE